MVDQNSAPDTVSLDHPPAASFFKDQWQHFISSKTVKALVGMEVAAVGVFIQQVISGAQPLTIVALKGWACIQGAIIFGFLIRHTLADIQAKVSGFVSPEMAQAIGDQAKAILVAEVTKKNPGLGAAIKAHVDEQG